jgi:hypothetical protein
MFSAFGVLRASLFYKARLAIAIALKHRRNTLGVAFFAEFIGFNAYSTISESFFSRNY